MDLPLEPPTWARLITVQNKVVLLSAAVRRTTPDPSTFSAVVPPSSLEAFTRAAASTAGGVWPR